MRFRFITLLHGLKIAGGFTVIGVFYFIPVNLILSPYAVCIPHIRQMTQFQQLSNDFQAKSLFLSNIFYKPLYLGYYIKLWFFQIQWVSKSSCAERVKKRQVSKSSGVCAAKTSCTAKSSCVFRATTFGNPLYQNPLSKICEKN